MKTNNEIARLVRKATGLTLKVSSVGSFVALRIEDPKGDVVFSKVSLAVTLVSGELQRKPVSGPVAHMGGIVTNWSF